MFGSSSPRLLILLVKYHDAISSFSIILPTKHIFKGKLLHSELLDHSNPLRIVTNIVHFENIYFILLNSPRQRI